MDTQLAPHRFIGVSVNERTRLMPPSPTPSSVVSGLRAVDLAAGSARQTYPNTRNGESKPVPLGSTSSSSSASASASSSSSSSGFSLLCCSARLNSFFHITERGSSIGQEIRTGCVTFVTMAYILIVNAQILSKSGPNDDGDWMNFDSIVAGTAISAAIGSALVGLWGNLPFGLAPGMGLNSYFTYGVCLRLGLSWPIALTSCFFQGLLFLLLSLIGACDLIQLYAPSCIKKSITVGLGLFQALIGFELMRLVIPGEETLLELGDMTDLKIYLSIGGMMLICMLLVWKVKAAMLVGIMMITVASWLLGLTPMPESVIEMPTLSHPWRMLDIDGYFQQLDRTLPVTLVMLFVAVFDTAGVQYMCGTEAELMDEETDTLPGAKAAFASAGIATAIGAMVGTSPVIIHNETIAGISDGARTGLHSLTVAILFLLSIPFVPILRAVPPIAAAAPLVIVGLCMMIAAKFIDWEVTHEAMPAFLCATVLPFTYSIANGMLVGLLSYVVLKSAHRMGEWYDPKRFATSASSAAASKKRCKLLDVHCECETCLAREILEEIETNRIIDEDGDRVTITIPHVQMRHGERSRKEEILQDLMSGGRTFPEKGRSTRRHDTLSDSIVDDDDSHEGASGQSPIRITSPTTLSTIIANQHKSSLLTISDNEDDEVGRLN